MPMPLTARLKRRKKQSTFSMSSRKSITHQNKGWGHLLSYFFVYQIECSGPLVLLNVNMIVKNVAIFSTL